MEKTKRFFMLDDILHIVTAENDIKLMEDSGACELQLEVIKDFNGNVLSACLVDGKEIGIMLYSGVKERIAFYRYKDGDVPHDVAESLLSAMAYMEKK